MKDSERKEMMEAKARARAAAEEARKKKENQGTNEFGHRINTMSGAIDAYLEKGAKFSEIVKGLKSQYPKKEEKALYNKIKLHLTTWEKRVGRALTIKKAKELPDWWVKLGLDQEKPTKAKTKKKKAKGGKKKKYVKD